MKLVTFFSCLLMNQSMSSVHTTVVKVFSLTEFWCMLILPTEHVEALHIALAGKSNKASCQEFITAVFWC